MATLEELRDDLRDRKLVEESTNYFSNDALFEMVRDSSLELAASFRFPKRTQDLTSQAAGTTSLTLSHAPLDVAQVSFEGVSARRASRSTLRFYQGLGNEAHPRVWYFDPLVGGSEVLVGPGNFNQGDYQVEYVGPVYTSTPTTSTEAWDGFFPEFHELIVLRAAVKAFEMGFEYENSAHYFQRHNQLLADLARRLGMQVPQGEAA